MSMREQYGITFARFWEGTTGRQIQAKGKDACLLGLYLQSCRHANMIGLYELPLVHVQQDLPVLNGRDPILRAFHDLQVVEYATYDLGTEHVWVREMARIRLGLGPADVLQARDDKRHAGVLRLYASVKANPHLTPFYDRYYGQLRLKEARLGPPLLSVAEVLKRASPIGLGKGIYRVSLSTESGSVQVPVQERTAEKAAAAPQHEPTEDPDPQGNYAVITAVVAKDILPRRLPDQELMEATTARCAQLGIACDVLVARKAIDSALFRYYRQLRLDNGLPADPRGIYHDHLAPRRLGGHT